MPATPVLRGRDRSLGVLHDALAGAIAGRGQLVVISGEAGIGKTTLATAFAADAETAGAAVTWGRAWEFAEAPPYFPVLPCLRSLGIEPPGDAFELWEQVLAALARVPTPIVWIVEDLHAADLGTLDLLTFLAQPVRAMRMLVIVTARERDARVTDRMLQRLARMSRDGTELRLEPLVDGDVAAVVEATIGRSVSASALGKVVDLTGGNPLFVVECARALRAAGAIESTLGSLPPTVRQIVNERVAHLPEAAREMLAAGAVLGRELTAALVARMTGALPARVIDALLPALRGGVIRELSPGRFAFSHTIVRDAIEDAMDATARAELHGRAEAALASLGDSSETIVERARHALAAARPGNGDETLALVMRAAELLEHEGAFDRAFDLHIRVEAARVAGLVPAADPATKLHAARVARAAGRSDESRRLCDAVIGEARGRDPELLARAVLLQLTDVRPGVIDRAQVALIEEARDALGDRSPALACRVLARLATAIQPAPDPAVPMAIARDARARAHELADSALIVDVLELAGWGIAETPIAERMQWAEELRDRALAIGDLRKALTAYMWLATARIEVGDFAGFDQVIASMLGTSEELGHPRDRWRALLLASTRATTAGRFAVADRYVMEVEQLAALVDDPALARSLPLHRLMRTLVTRRDDEVRARLAEVETATVGVVNGTAIAALLQGVCLARIGDLDEARERLAVVTSRIPLATLATAPTAGRDPLFPYVAELMAAVGSAHERQLARALLPRYEGSEVTGGAFTFVYDGPVSRIRGLIAAAVGERDEAEAALRDALARARERDHGPWVAQIAAELAKLLAGTAVSRELADESARIARDLGMTGLAGAVASAEVGLLRFERSGTDWRISRGANAIVLRDSRGMQLLARLVEQPNQEIHVLALASDESASAPESSAGDVLDDSARKAYRRRLAELADALADAETRGDARQAATIERERGALVTELARATGLGGKSRVSASHTERARINVQKRIKEAVGRIAEADEELGRLVESSVQTGTYCRFRQ